MTSTGVAVEKGGGGVLTLMAVLPVVHLLSIGCLDALSRMPFMKVSCRYHTVEFSLFNPFCCPVFKTGHAVSTLLMFAEQASCNDVLAQCKC